MTLTRSERLFEGYSIVILILSSDTTDYFVGYGLLTFYPLVALRIIDALAEMSRPTVTRFLLINVTSSVG